MADTVIGPRVDHINPVLVLHNPHRGMEQRRQLPEQLTFDLREFLRGDKEDKNEGAVGELRHFRGAVAPVPEAVGGATRLVAVAVGEVPGAVGVVEGVAFGHRGDTIEAVVQTLLAVAGRVACAVVEEFVAAVAVLDRGAVGERPDLIGAVVAVKTAGVRIALRLPRERYIERELERTCTVNVHYMYRTIFIPHDAVKKVTVKLPFPVTCAM